MSGGMRAIAAWAVAVFFALPAWAADNLISLLQIGGTRDSINAITTDSNGNIIIAGSTSSFNLPVTNSSTNRGTPLSVSNDFGKTWGPLSPVAVSNLVLDASTPPILYGLGRSDPNVELNLVMKSTDGGKTLGPNRKLLRTLRARHGSGSTRRALRWRRLRNFKSTDGGQTWQAHFLAGSIKRRAYTSTTSLPILLNRMWSTPRSPISLIVLRMAARPGRSIRFQVRP